MKKLIVYPLIALVLYFTPDLCRQQTDGFSLGRIHSDLPYNSAWETASPDSAELHRYLVQPFRYLGSGGQCYAFASGDDQVVIKFFKHRFRKPYSLLLQTPLFGPLETLRQKKLAKALQKHNRDFSSYKLSFEQLRTETGLLYVHLNKTHHLHQTIEIIDKLGISHRLNLDDLEFVVQKRAEPVYDRIVHLMQVGDETRVKHTFHELVQVILTRCQKGIYDEDPRLHRNLGFVGERAIFIDVGRFCPDASRQKPEVYTKDLLLITKRLRAWLETQYPTLTPYLDEEVAAIQN